MSVCHAHPHCQIHQLTPTRPRGIEDVAQQIAAERRQDAARRAELVARWHRFTDWLADLWEAVLTLMQGRGWIFGAIVVLATLAALGVLDAMDPTGTDQPAPRISR